MSKTIPKKTLADVLRLMKSKEKETISINTESLLEKLTAHLTDNEIVATVLIGTFRKGTSSQTVTIGSETVSVADIIKKAEDNKVLPPIKIKLLFRFISSACTKVFIDMGTPIEFVKAMTPMEYGVAPAIEYLTSHLERTSTANFAASLKEKLFIYNKSINKYEKSTGLRNFWAGHMVQFIYVNTQRFDAGDLIAVLKAIFEMSFFSRKELDAIIQVSKERRDFIMASNPKIKNPSDLSKVIFGCEWTATKKTNQLSLAGGRMKSFKAKWMSTPFGILTKLKL